MPREGKYAPSTLLRPATSVALWSANSASESVASPAGFQNAASPRPVAAIAACPIPTAWAPTGKTRKSAPALMGASWAASWTIGMLERTNIPTVHPSNILLERRRLIDQHDGNVVFDGVHQAARTARQRLGIGPVLERTFALGADQDQSRGAGVRYVPPGVRRRRRHSH